MITFEEILDGSLGDHEATLAKEWLDAGAKITPPVADTDWVNVDTRPGHLDCRIFLKDLQVLGVPPDQPTITQSKLNTAAANTPISTKKRTRNQISSAAVDHANAAPPPPPPHRQQLHWRALGATDYSLTHKVDISPEGLLCIGANDTSSMKKTINDFFPQLVDGLVKKAKRKNDGAADAAGGGDGGPSTSAAAAAATTTTNTNNINTKANTKPTTNSIEDSRSTALTLLPKDWVPDLLFHTVVGTGRIPGYIGRAQLEQTWPEAVQQGNTCSNNNKKRIAIKVTTHHMTGRDLTWDLELVKRSRKGDEDSGNDEDDDDDDDKGKGDGGDASDNKEEEGGGEKYYLAGQIAGLLKKLKAQSGDVMSVIKTPDYSGMFDQEDNEEEEEEADAEEEGGKGKDGGGGGREGEGGGGGGGGGGEPAAIAVGVGNEERKDKEPMDNDAGTSAGKQSEINKGDIDMIDAQPAAVAAIGKEKQAPAEPPYIYLVELNAPEVLNAIASLAEEEEDMSALPGPSAAAAAAAPLPSPPPPPPPPPFPPPPQRPSSPYTIAMKNIGRFTMTWVKERARGAPPPPPDIVGEKNACIARLVAQRRRAALYLKQRKAAFNAVNPPKEVRSPVAIRGGKKSPGSGVGGSGGKSSGGGGGGGRRGGLSPKGLDLGEKKKVSKKKKDGKKG